jgi:hypothetical protein
MMNDQENRIVLTGDEALQKFLAGKEVWNAYIEQYPEADVNFSGVDFSKHSKEANRRLNFSGYLFPLKGDVYFTRARFGEGNVSFHEATFGEGVVDFRYATFGKGHVNFGGARFGQGDVNFRYATFGTGYVNFRKVTFGKGAVNFMAATFDGGYVNFRETTFGEGDVNFKGARILGPADFSALITPSTITSLHFRHCTFGHSLNLSGNHLRCIPDLTYTKISHQISLDGLECEPLLNEKGIPDPKDGDRLCRLKEIAETNKNHEQALNFHIKEMRVKRHHLSGLNLTIDKAFDAVSEYGRSVMKPLAWLIRSWYVSGLIYSFISIYLSPLKSGLEHFGNGFLYAIAQAIPFVAAGRESSKASITALFGDDVPIYLFFISLTQGLISFLLIFLIGLALRNRFRI